MANLNNNNNTFYLAFKDVHPSWSLIGCALPLGIISTIGILFNFSLIYVTIRSKSLHGTVNYILALYSFMEVLHQHGNFLFVYTAFSGQNFIEYRLAVKLKLLSAFGLGGNYPTIFFTGIDRLIELTFDEMKSKRKIRLYLATVTIICCMFSLELCISLYQKMEVYVDQMVTGTFTDFFKGASHHTFIWLFFIFMTCIIYLILGILIKIKSAGLPSANQIKCRTFRSLFCIIFINIGGYFIASINQLLIMRYISSPITAWFVQLLTAVPLNIGAASNGPILYITSTEYRQAFQTNLPFIFKRISAQNRTVQQQNVQPLGLNTTKL
ncbi:hypothetical protein niasHT_038530 [Heterodera trifolii]|uniref:Uncharacterized protein n=1 Tax=Heterodera trifolii TaxID=157864 RepID=A0ABD2I2Y0_9BILA